MVNIPSKKFYDRTKPFFSINTYNNYFCKQATISYGKPSLNLNRISSLKDFFYLFSLFIYYNKAMQINTHLYLQAEHFTEREISCKYRHLLHDWDSFSLNTPQTTLASNRINSPRNLQSLVTIYILHLTPPLLHTHTFPLISPFH